MTTSEPPLQDRGEAGPECRGEGRGHVLRVGRSHLGICKCESGHLRGEVRNGAESGLGQSFRPCAPPPLDRKVPLTSEGLWYSKFPSAGVGSPASLSPLPPPVSLCSCPSTFLASPTCPSFSSRSQGSSEGKPRMTLTVVEMRSPHGGLTDGPQNAPTTCLHPFFQSTPALSSHLPTSIRMIGLQAPPWLPPSVPRQGGWCQDGRPL